MNNLKQIQAEIPADFLLSFDHMKKDTTPVSQLDTAGWNEALIRFRDVKKAELLIGRNLSFDDPVLANPAELERLIEQTFEKLLPLYKLAVDTPSL